MILLYCVVRSDLSLSLPDSGVAGKPLSSLVVDNLRAVYSEIESAPEGPEVMQAAVMFQSVIQRLFGQTLVIPFRFPTLFNSADELETELSSTAPKYLAALPKLEGCSQFEWKMVQKARPLATSFQSGTEYLKSRASSEQDVQSLTTRVKESMKEYALEWREREAQDGFRLYALVRRTSEVDVRKLVKPLTMHDRLGVTVSGPWPPAEFVEAQP